jgi:hypothetical protein
LAQKNGIHDKIQNHFTKVYLGITCGAAYSISPTAAQFPCLCLANGFRTLWLASFIPRNKFVQMAFVFEMVVL